MARIDGSPKSKEIKEIVELHAGKWRPKDIWQKTRRLDENITHLAIAAYCKKLGKRYTKRNISLAYKSPSERKKYKPERITPKTNKGRESMVYFATEILAMRLHFGQIKFLKLAQAMIEKQVKYQKLILCPAYQWGKTSSLAIVHIWCNYYKIGLPPGAKITDLEYQTLSISPKLGQSQILYKYIQWIIQGKFFWFEGRKKIFKTNQSKIQSFLKKPLNLPSPNTLSNTPIEFQNGAKIRIASTKGDQAANLAGDQFAFLSYDECVLSHHLEDELPTRILSRLTKFGGSMVLVSTPDPMAESNQYYMHICQLGLEGKKGFKTMMGKLDDNFFIQEKNRERIKQSIKDTNPELYDAAVHGKFSSSISRIYTSAEIEKVWDDDLKLEDPRSGHYYYIGIDWAMAGGWTVMFVLDVTKKPYKIVHMDRYRGSTMRPEEQYAKVIALRAKYNNAQGVHDTTSMGGKIIASDLEDIGFYDLDYAGPDTKGNIIYALKKTMAEGNLRSPYIAQLARELGSYKLKDQNLTKDCICALASIFYVLEEETGRGVTAVDINL